MQRLEVSGAVRPLKGLLGVKGLNSWNMFTPVKEISTIFKDFLNWQKKISNNNKRR